MLNHKCACSQGDGHRMCMCIIRLARARASCPPFFTRQLIAPWPYRRLASCRAGCCYSDLFSIVVVSSPIQAGQHRDDVVLSLIASLGLAAADRPFKYLVKLALRYCFEHLKEFSINNTTDNKIVMVSMVVQALIIFSPCRKPQ